jgi:hypothetical protein
MIEILVWPMAAGLFFLGAFAVAAPSRASALFGLPSDGAWVQVAGVRDVFLGFAFLLAHLHGSRPLVGELCLATLVVPAVDAWVTWRAGARRFSCAHIAGALGVAIYGCLLLFSSW